MAAVEAEGVSEAAKRAGGRERHVQAFAFHISFSTPTVTRPDPRRLRSKINYRIYWGVAVGGSGRMHCASRYICAPIKHRKRELSI